MKKMYSNAKAENQAKKLQENLQDVYNKDDENDFAKDKIFFEDLKEKADLRYSE